MNHQFDEITKSLAQSVTRRAALKRFGVGLAGMALARFGLTTRANGGPATYTTIDFPDAVFTIAAGINSGGAIVGRFIDGVGVHHVFC